jgi:hypothetical protein
VFGVGNVIKVGANVVGTSIAATQGISAIQNSTYLGLAANVYRANITAVPGSGAALGAVLYKDTLYAFRANAGGTQVNLYKSSAAGWVNVPYYKEVYFTSGTSAAAIPKEGDTLTQGGVTALVKRVVLQKGAWGTNAQGKLIIDTPSGGNFAAGAATSLAYPLTLAGIQVQISFAIGGNFEFSTGNFYGSAATNRVYGCDNKNRSFEFDGDILVPIDTGAVVDKPKHIVIHKNILFVSQGASILYSAPGLPYNWQAISYAGEIGTGEDVTGLKVMAGSSTTAALLVTSRDNTFILYGTDPQLFNFVAYNSGSGAIDYTIQNLSDSYMMDDRGVVSLKASLNYGNFDQSTLTFNINKFIELHRTKASCATLARRKSQYRLFFNDGFALYITIVNGNLVGTMPIYFPTPAYACEEGKFSTGEDVMFFCGTDGFVYQLDKGTSFDGQAINAFFTLKFHSVASARILKRYRKAAIEISGTGYCAINFSYQLGYGSSDISQANSQTYENNIQFPTWDNFTWDNFTWDGQTIMPNECQMSGTAENVAITIRSGSAYFNEYTVNSAIIHYSQRRALR